MNINLKSLVGKLNETSRRALESAAGLCLSRSNYNVEVEHWLLKLLEASDTDLARLLRHYEIDQSRVETELTRSIDHLKTGNSRPPALSQKIVDLIREAWVFTSVEYSASKIRSGHLLLALLSEKELSRMVRDSAPELSTIPVDALIRELRDVTDGSAEDEADIAAYHEQAAAGDAPKRSGKTPALDQYTVNLTLRAQQGKIDPVVGRDFEIRQLIDILMRRRQNNPILTGEAGVGKTAVAEGFAQRIADGDVPPPLRNVSLRTLDLGLLQAGAGVKGEFENRLKSVMNEVKSSPQPIILFIDEAHTLIGAGGQAGQGDAANLLKPALARGELRTVAATTWSEYKKYFEKDAALARRFQVVKVEEPDEEQAIIMMRGIVKSLEKHHGLEILEEGIEDAVRLSRRYITGRQLPDKAVSILDTAAARVAIGHAAVPAPIEDARRDIDHLALQIDILNREENAGADHSERIAELDSRKQDVSDRLEKLENRWKKEQELVQQIREIRKQLATGVKSASIIDQATEAASGEQTAEEDQVKLTDQEKETLRTDLTKLTETLEDIQGENPLMQVCVDSQTIAEVISGWTGIPVGKMLTDEIRMISSLKERMGKRIVGQSHALEAISKRIQTARANLVDPRRPVGVFMLVGPSGVGKTETALTLADIMY
ncbi:MAG: type VI secretion system ATPase TssH, partial [Planctomycetes bacterium]|nr:type VI secretion system ATPase TssH [Planctomycetota bacterium]